VGAGDDASSAHRVARLCGKSGYLFGDEFRRYIENDLMKREPHPDAKPMGVFTIAPRTE